MRPLREPGRDLGLAGGILGRVDDMLIVRGVNVFPSSVEAVMREFPEIAQFQVEVRRSPTLTDLVLRAEIAGDPAAVARALERRLQDRLSLRVPVHPVAPGSLPRFELKARRWTTVDVQSSL